MINYYEYIINYIKNNDNLSSYDYIKLYLELTDAGKVRGLSKIDGEYTEVHHILPRSKGGTNEEANLVRLTIKEHVLAHLLLYLAFPDDNLLAYTAACLLNMGDTRYRKPGGFSKEEILDKLEILEADIIAAKREYESERQGIPVVCYDLNSFKVLRVYRSTSSANKEGGFRIEGVYAFIAGKQTEVGGCGFCYLDNFKKDHHEELEEYYENLYSGFLPNIDEYRVESGRLHKRAVVAFNEDLTVVGIYGSIRETEEFGCREKSLGKAIRTKGLHMGYRWDYYDNFITYGNQNLKDFVNSGQKNKDNFTKVKRIYKTKRLAACDPITGRIVEVFPSLRSAVDAGHDSSGIWKAMSGHMSKHHGYTWKYLND